MSTFFQQYKSYIIITASIIGFMGLIFIVVISINSSPTTPQNVEPTSDPNQLDYQFIADDSLTTEDKYLMLQGKIIIEQYGTYSSTDVRGLWDVKNQSTSSFAVKVDQLINAAAKPSLETIVDPDTIQIQKSSNLVTVRLQANQRNTITNQTNQITYSVEFVKNGQFWEVNNITEQ